jgi:hypothetical protein
MKHRENACSTDYTSSTYGNVTPHKWHIVMKFKKHLRYQYSKIELYR